MTALPTLRRLANQLNIRLMSEAQAHPQRQAMQHGAAVRIEAPSARTERPFPAYEAVRAVFPIGLAMVGLSGVATLALVASHAAEPLVLTLMAGLATVGVFFLFALAARHIRFGQASTDTDLLRGIVDADEGGVLVTDGTGRIIAHNKAFAGLAGTNALGEVNALDALFASEPAATEAIFRLNRAVERGETARDERAEEREFHAVSAASSAASVCGREAGTSCTTNPEPAAMSARASARSAAASRPASDSVWRQLAMNALRSATVKAPMPCQLLGSFSARNAWIF